VIAEVQKQAGDEEALACPLFVVFPCHEM